MKSLLFLIFTLHLTAAANYSLQFLLTGITPGISFPEFTAVSELDGLQVAYYDSNSRNVALKAEWIKNNTDEPHWDKIKQMAYRYQDAFKTSINETMQLFKQTEGIHTWQWTIGCELHDDEIKRQYSRFGYDGEDFLSLDLNTSTWTAANQKAVTTKQQWETTSKATDHKIFLETECIEWLQKYVDYGRATLERKVSPEVSVFQRDSSSPVVCHATGFFPKAVMISWQKNGEDLHEEVELRETLPNQDGTFQKRSVLTVSPEELNKHNYTCIIQHSSLEKEMVLIVINHRVSGGGFTGIIGAVVAVLLLSLIGFAVGVLMWRRKKKEPGFKAVSANPSASSDGGSSSNNL